MTAALVVTSLELYRHNERRLLNLRVREVGLVLSGAASSVQTPLASAAALADATGGDPRRFRAFVAPSVGAGRQFTSVSLWVPGAAAAARGGRHPAVRGGPHRRPARCGQTRAC